MSAKKFIDELKNLAKGNSSGAEIIWRGLESPDAIQNVSYFCLYLFENMISSDKKAQAYQNEERLLSTLLVMEFYKNKKPKSQKVLDECKKLLEHRKSKIYGHGLWVLSLFMQTEQREDFIHYFICRLVYSPRHIREDEDAGHQIDDMIEESHIYTMQLNMYNHQKFYSCLKFACFPPIRGVQTKILAFSYVCFLDYVRSNNNYLNKGLYGHIRDLLKFHMQALNTSKKTGVYLSVLIHFIQTMITFYGCEDEQILKDMLFFSSHLRNSPGVIGEMGCELFKLLQQQLKSTGNAFRKKLRSDFPSLDIKQSSFINKEYYLVTNRSDFLSCPEYCSILNLRKMVILQIIQTCGLQINLELKHLIRDLSSFDTFNLYYKAQKIMDIASTLQVYEKIRTIQRESIEELIKMIKDELAQEKNKNKISEQEQLEFEELTKEANPLRIFEYPTYEIVHVPIGQFISRNDEYNFISIAKKNRTEFPQLSFYRNKIPIVFYGDGSEFFVVLQMLADYIENTDIEYARQLRVFYIPKAEFIYRSGIANYLSRKDAWYRRFIFHPFRERMLYPNLEIDAKMKDLFPSYLYNKSMHLYLREAKRNFPIRVFKCYLKVADKKDQELVYFCSQIFIGTSCDAKILREQKTQEKEKEKKYLSIDYIELLTEKLKKVNPLSLYFEAKVYDPLRKKLEVKSEKNLKVEDLQILNFPSEYFMGNKPDPLSPYLESAILTQHSGKIFRKEVLNKENFKLHRDEQIQQVFKDLFICMTIESVVIENLDRGVNLKVSIDGTVRNKIERIRIQPAFSKNGLPLTIPIQCFLPFT